MLTPHSGNSQNARFTVWHFSRDEQAFSYQTLDELAADGVADRIRKIGYAERGIVGDEAKRVTERDRPVHRRPPKTSAARSSRSRAAAKRGAVRTSVSSSAGGSAGAAPRSSAGGAHVCD